MMHDATMDDDEGHNVPNILLDLDEYPSLWKPWHLALMTKVLGRSITFRVLE